LKLLEGLEIIIILAKLRVDEYLHSIQGHAQWEAVTLSAVLPSLIDAELGNTTRQRTEVMLQL
jgi:hypothetical protein